MCGYDVATKKNYSCPCSFLSPKHFGMYFTIPPSVGVVRQMVSSKDLVNNDFDASACGLSCSSAVIAKANGIEPFESYNQASKEGQYL